MRMDGGIPVFDGEGYEIWSKKMKTLFVSQQLWDVVEQGYREEATNNKLRLRDAKALYLIQQGVSYSVFPVIMEAKRSKEAWDAIRNKFESRIIADDEAVTICIDQMLSKLSIVSSERCIFRVPYALRNGNEEFYEPTVLAIGPYHRGKPHLASMEEHKIRYMKLLLQEMGYQSVDRFVQAIMPQEQRVRKCYAESIDYVSRVELVQMLVLDGCFIIEYFRRYDQRPYSDPVVYSDILSLLPGLHRDLMLIENQIPFFILEILFDMIKHDVATCKELKDLILFFFGKDYRKIEWTIEDRDQLFSKNVCHLMDFIHEIACFGFPQRSSSTSLCMFVNSATKLEEANVKLKASPSTTRSMFDITYREGELNIPSFEVHDSSEVEIRNFIAFELCSQFHLQRHFCDFVVFMDHLIMSSDDVVLLTDRGIINNSMIDFSSVDNMFKRLTRDITITNLYTYNDISIELDKYGRLPWNKWSASLKQKYFNTLWAIISFIAASVLLVLTVTQTVFSIIS